jgi:hypothetical protein
MWAFSSAGRALPLQGRCRGFNPLNAHHISNTSCPQPHFFFKLDADRFSLHYLSVATLNSQTTILVKVMWNLLKLS